MVCRGGVVLKVSTGVRVLCWWEFFFCFRVECCFCVLCLLLNFAVLKCFDFNLNSFAGETFALQGLNFLLYIV